MRRVATCERSVFAIWSRPMIKETSRRQFLVQFTETAAFVAAASVLGGVRALADDKSAVAPAWKAGVAKAVITPEKGVWLAGYGSKRPPDGKLHDLWMKALALEDTRGHRVVMITSDFQGVPKVMSDPAFDEMQKQ